MNARLPIVVSAYERPVAPAGLQALRAPREVKVRLLQACDLRCEMCWHWQDPERGRKQLPLERLRALWSELRALGVARVKLTGGEPTLRKDLCEIVAAARREGLGVTLATNAARFSADAVDRLVDAGVDTFHVSLDADGAEVHDAIRGAPGAFEGTVATLAHLRDRHGATKRVVSAVVQRESIGHLAGLAPLCGELGVRALYLLAINTEPYCAGSRPSRAELARYFFDELPRLFEAARPSRLKVTPAPIFRALRSLDARRCAAALREAAKDGGDAFADELDAFAEERYGAFVYAEEGCGEIGARSEIAETGEVYPCCHGEVPELSMGNVLCEPFAEIWARARYRAFRDPAGPLPHHPRCRSCKDAQGDGVPRP